MSPPPLVPLCAVFSISLLSWIKVASGLQNGCCSTSHYVHSCFRQRRRESHQWACRPSQSLFREHFQQLYTTVNSFIPLAGIQSHGPPYLGRSLGNVTLQLGTLPPPTTSGFGKDEERNTFRIGHQMSVTPPAQLWPCLCLADDLLH